MAATMVTGSSVDQRTPSDAVRTRRRLLRHRLRRDWPLLVMTGPALLLFLLFYYVPLPGYVIAFQDYSPFTGFTKSPFIGLANFERLFGDPDFWNAAKNTVELTALQVVFAFPAAIGLALLLNTLVSRRVKAFIQNVVYLPHFLSWVVVVILFQQMLGQAGPLREVLPVDVTTSAGLFKAIVTAQVMWKETGWGTIIFLAALSTISTELYEAAAADGAGPWRRLWHVTLPGLRPVIVLLLTLRLGEVLNVGFEQILLQRNAVGAHSAEVLDTFVYYNGVIAGDWAYGAAAGLFKGVVGLLLVLAANRAAHALGEQGVYSRS